MESPGFLIRKPKSQNERPASLIFGSRLSVFRCRTRAFSKFPFLVHRGCAKYIGAVICEDAIPRVPSLKQGVRLHCFKDASEFFNPPASAYGRPALSVGNG